MPRIENVKAVQRKLRDLIAKSMKKDIGGVIVGYTAAYALYVHENKEMKLKGKRREIWFTSKQGHKIRIKGKFGKGRYWDPQGKGQSKFLEQPAREKQDVLAALVVKAAKAGLGLQKALVIAGLRLQRESQKLVPVDTGNLKGSAFVEED